MTPWQILSKPIRLVVSGEVTQTTGMITAIEEDEIGFDVGSGVLFIPNDRFIRLDNVGSEIHMHLSKFEFRYTPKLVEALNERND